MNCYTCITEEEAMKTTLAIRLPEDINDRLDKLARQTGRTKTFYAREAILEHIEDLEDTYIATERLKKSERTWTMEEVEEQLGILDD